MTPAREQWRPVPGYEGLYEASDQGRVRSLDRTVMFGQGLRGRRLQGRVLRPKRARGRLLVSLSKDGAVSTERVHILVLTAFIGPRPPGMAGCHNNGDALDNCLSNLRWDTWSENTKDQVRHGVHAEASKTHCPRNHMLLEPNLIASHAKRGTRSCLACHRAASAVQRATQKGSELDMQRESDKYYLWILENAVFTALPGETNAYSASAEYGQRSAQLKG